VILAGTEPDGQKSAGTGGRQRVVEQAVPTESNAGPDLDAAGA
jgi:hypothetical protein